MINQPSDETTSERALPQTLTLSEPSGTTDKSGLQSSDRYSPVLRERLLFYSQRLIAASKNRTDKDDAELGRLHYQLARTRAELQDYFAAKSHSEAANYFFEIAQQPASQAQVLLLLGGVRDELDEYQAAIWDLERVLELSKQLDDRTLQALAFDSLGQLFEREGELEKALEQYQQAEKLLGLADAFSETEAVRLLRAEIVASVAFVQLELIVQQALALAERITGPVTSPIELPTPGDPRFPATTSRASRPSKSRPPRRRRRWWW